MVFNIGGKDLRKVAGSRLIIVLGIACAAVLSFYLAKEIAASGTVQAQAAFTPYQFQMDVYNYQEDSQGTLWIQKSEYRRSDGATASSEDTTNTVGEHATRKVRMPDGTITIIEDDIGAKTTCRPKSPDSGQAWMDLMAHPPRSCVISPGENLARYEKLLGQTVAVVVTSLPSGRVMTNWKAPALGCLTLKYQVREKQSDGSMKLITDGRPVSLKLTEPDPSLFATDPSYAELSPSQRIQKVFQHEGRTLTQSQQQTYQFLDHNHAAVCQQ